jgi:hypothetical protein
LKNFYFLEKLFLNTIKFTWSRSTFFTTKKKLFNKSINFSNYFIAFFSYSPVVWSFWFNLYISSSINKFEETIS